MSWEPASPVPVSPLQLGALTPLHIAAALPGEEGVKVTELLLHAVTAVAARAADQADVYQPGKVRWPGCGAGVLRPQGPPVRSSVSRHCPQRA